jgi:hypothetical protein
MLGEFPEGRVRSLQKGSVLVSSGPRRGTVAGLQRRLRARDEVPTSGQIVLRSISQTLR